MTRTALAALVGLVLGAGLHIFIVLLVPSFAVRDAWSAAARLGPDGAFHVLPSPTSGDARSHDPNFVEAVCRFSAQSEPARVVARFPNTFWSAAIFDREGRNVYSLNNAAGEESELDLIVYGPAQAQPEGAQALPSESAIVVAELPIEAGLIILRAFLPDGPAFDSTVALLGEAECSAPN